MTRVHCAGRIVLPALTAASLAAGCAGSVPADQVASSITGDLHRLGIAAVDVACPGHLNALVGTSIGCTFAVDGQTVDAVATVAEVRSGRARYDIVTAARPIAETLLEGRLAADVPRHGGGTGSVNCPGDLPATGGASLVCSVQGAPDVRVTVTSVTGGEIRFAVVEN